MFAWFSPRKKAAEVTPPRHDEETPPRPVVVEETPPRSQSLQPGNAASPGSEGSAAAASLCSLDVAKVNAAAPTDEHTIHNIHDNVISQAYISPPKGPREGTLFL